MIFREQTNINCSQPMWLPCGLDLVILFLEIMLSQWEDRLIDYSMIGRQVRLLMLLSPALWAWVLYCHAKMLPQIKHPLYWCVLWLFLSLEKDLLSLFYDGILATVKWSLSLTGMRNHCDKRWHSGSLLFLKQTMNQWLVEDDRKGKLFCQTSVTFSIVFV